MTSIHVMRWRWQVHREHSRGFRAISILTTGTTTRAGSTAHLKPAKESFNGGTTTGIPQKV
eukprot:9994524-Karenia_brevis.AAC.1